MWRHLLTANQMLICIFSASSRRRLRQWNLASLLWGEKLRQQIRRPRFVSALLSLTSLNMNMSAHVFHSLCSPDGPFSSGSARLCRLWTPPGWAPAPVQPPAPAAPPPPPSPAPPRCLPPAHTNARCRRCRTTRPCRCRCTTSRLTTAASSGSAWTWRTGTCTRASWWGIRRSLSFGGMKLHFQFVFF